MLAFPMDIWIFGALQGIRTEHVKKKKRPTGYVVVILFFFLGGGGVIENHEIYETCHIFFVEFL